MGYEWVNLMCQIRLCMPTWVSCYVNTIRDTGAAFTDVRAVITLMDIMTDSSTCGDRVEDC